MLDGLGKGTLEITEGEIERPGVFADAGANMSRRNGIKCVDMNLVVDRGPKRSHKVVEDVLELPEVGDGREDVSVDVEFLWNPDLLSSFVNNGVLMRVSVGSSGAGRRLEEMRIKADVIDRCWDGSRGADDGGSRRTR